MKRGFLSEYFEGVAMKRLSAVEADVARSNQHEYNATREILDFLGRPSGRQKLDARFIYLSDDEDASVVEDASLTLYDSREAHPTRSEYRIYFPRTQVSELACEGDVLTIAKARNGRVLAITAQAGSSMAAQLAWLFGIEDRPGGFISRTDLDGERDRVGLAASFILESIGIIVEEHAPDAYLDVLVQKFGRSFPSSKVFSAFARDTLREVDATDDPDIALMRWMEREEMLFRSFERHLAAERLAQGFSAERIDEFLAFSLSIQNRRKSRVGLALENHLSVILDAHGIRYARTAITENKSKPDFLFPGGGEYHDHLYDPGLLTMLAAKSTCKDRWRQVLAEADRIPVKHLVTLEAAISVSQTDEMKSKLLQLVIPKPLHETYSPAQQGWLFDLRDFLTLVTNRQA